MKRFYLALSLMLSLSSVAYAVPLKPAVRPSLSNLTATQAILANELIKDRAYKLHMAPGLQVEQSANDGFLVRFSSGYSPFGEIPSVLFLKTSRQYADNTFISSDLCVTYTGLYRYMNVMGANRTIHAFNEVSCKNYALPQAWINERNAQIIADGEQRLLALTNEYLRSALRPIAQNWQVPNLELSWDKKKPTVISAIIAKDGQIYNAKIEESAENLEPAPIKIETDQQAYQQQMRGFLHQNYQLVDNSGLQALAATTTPPFPEGWTMAGFNVKLKFDPYAKNVSIEYISQFTGDIKTLTKTIPQPVAIYYPKRPEPPLSIEAQASIQQAKFIQQQSQSKQREQQTQTNIINSLGILGNFLPLLH